jgi:hypothetical protein
MEISKVSKTLSNYYCEYCNYSCSRKSDFNKHLLTVKHSISKDGNQMETEETAKSPKIFGCECGKIYNNRSGLWKHKKKCEPKTENITISIEEEQPENNNFSGDFIVELLKQNQEFKELLIEQNKQMLELSKDRNITNNITQNNTNNNKFNLNVFLNETCKDALNLSDFLESLILTLTDFENFGPLGYCGGISNILVR